MWAKSFRQFPKVPAGPPPEFANDADTITASISASNASFQALADRRQRPSESQRPPRARDR
jgi:hypothetical protein